MKSIFCHFLTFYFLLGSLLISNLGETKPKETTRREHGSHIHGQASLSLAFDSLNGHFEFVAASESLLGFEHPAKSTSDKKTLLDLKAQLKNNISKYVQFNEALACKWTLSSADMVFEKMHSNHSNFVAKFEIFCGKPVEATRLILDFTAFKKLQDIDVTILIGDLQLKSELKSKSVTIELK